MEPLTRIILLDRHTSPEQLAVHLPQLARFAQLNYRKGATDESYHRISISLQEYATPIGIENAIMQGAVVGIMMKRNRVAGMISFTPVTRKAKGKEPVQTKVHENFVCVHPVYAGQKIGERLRHAMVEWAHQRDHLLITSHAITSRSLRGYQRLSEEIQRPNTPHPLAGIIHHVEIRPDHTQGTHHINIHLKNKKPPMRRHP